MLIQKRLGKPNLFLCINLLILIIEFKMKKYFFCFKIMILLICSIVGVGFVSGAEIYQFFVKFGKFSYFGVFVFFVLIFALTNKILRQNQSEQNVFKMNILTKIVSNNTFLTKSKLKSKLLFVNILMMASAMFAGLFNLIFKLYFHNHLLILIFALSIIFLVLYFGISGLQKFDYFVIVLLGIILCCFCFCSNDISLNQNAFFIFEFKNLIFSGLFSAIYVFMNIVQIQPILSEKNIQLSGKERKGFAFGFSLILTIILFVFVRFFNANLYLKNSQMPFLNYFSCKGGVVYLIYVIGLFLALFSSLITTLVGVKSRLNKRLNSNLLSSVGAIVLSSAISLIGFSNFISIVYPIVGIINFVIYVFL